MPATAMTPVGAPGGVVEMMLFPLRETVPTDKARPFKDAPAPIDTAPFARVVPTKFAPAPIATAPVVRQKTLPGWALLIRLTLVLAAELNAASILKIKIEFELPWPSKVTAPPLILMAPDA